jgi:predicted restriction endonuclease
LDRLEDEGYFSPSSIKDKREKTFREIVARRGQGRFRESLLKAYQGRCAVSGCDAEAALEAAHLIPYLGKQTNHVQNGILLRADIHTIFDLDLIGIDPRTLKLCLGPPLTDSSYSEFEGCELALPLDSRLAPSPEALKERWKRFKASSKK